MPRPPRSPLRSRPALAPAARTRAALALAAVTLAGCGDTPPTVTELLPGPVRQLLAPTAGPGLALVFLSPVGPTLPAGQTYTGTFDGTRAPVVEVCPIATRTASACAGPAVARWTLQEGTGGTPLTVSATAQSYTAQWPITGLAAGSSWRIRVLLDGAEMGRAEARVPAAGETATALRAAGWVPLGNTTRFPIRFRLETAADYLPGAPTAPAALPDREYVPRQGDYSATHPEMPGAYPSFNTLMLSLAPGLTTAQVNGLVAGLRASVVGALPGAPGVTGGILFLRVPTATHAEMEALLAGLRQDARVRAAAQDALGGPQVASRRPSDAGAESWTWDATPGGGNWGFEVARVPQLWNLNAAVKKARLDVGARPVAVFDDGFAAAHPDLAIAQRTGSGGEARHGTMVAGVLGARVDNGLGIDGVDPFARITGRGFVVYSDGNEMEWRLSFGQQQIDAVSRFVRGNPHVRVLNLSMGYNWSHAKPAPIGTDRPAVQGMVAGQGAVALDMLRAVAVVGPLPLILHSSGNDSDAGLGPQPARWNSPLAHAALVGGAANVVVVEAVAHTSGSGSVRAGFSNPGGHLSAPGANVLLTTYDRTKATPYTYETASGTSFATPFVAGIASYLYTLAPTLPAPTLTSNPVRDLLLASALPASGAAPRVDAFGAALAVDGLTGGDRVLRMLLDVDDGTPDGNARTTATGADDPRTDADGDGGPGDGRIDMKDFRRWRDALLQVEGRASAHLDGSPRHPKKDLNANDRWPADGDDENVFPRVDFNGDGRVSRDGVGVLPGALGGAVLTDLQVLRMRFQDPDVQQFELDGLVQSFDVTVDAAACRAIPGAARVRARAWPTGQPASAGAWRAFAGDTAVRVFTLATARGAQTVRVEALDASGQVLGAGERNVGLLPAGADVHWKPTCAKVTVTPGAPVLKPGAAQPFAATVAYVADQRVTWTARAGTITPAGAYTAPSTDGRYVVVATSVADTTARDSAIVTVASVSGRVVAIRRTVGAAAGAGAGTPNWQEFRDDRLTGLADHLPTLDAAWNGQIAAYRDSPDFGGWVIGASSALRGVLKAGVRADSTFGGITAEASGTSSATAGTYGQWEPSPETRKAKAAMGGAWMQTDFEFEVRDAAVRWRMDGSCGLPNDASFGGVALVRMDYSYVVHVECQPHINGRYSHQVSTSGTLPPGRYRFVLSMRHLVYGSLDAPGSGSSAVKGRLVFEP